MYFELYNKFSDLSSMFSNLSFANWADFFKSFTNLSIMRLKASALQKRQIKILIMMLTNLNSGIII